MFNAVGIVGVGLIGASMAIEIRNENISDTIIGFDSNQESLDLAVNEGIIDGYATLDEIGICDFVIVATPVSSIATIIKNILPKLKKGSIVIDVGSVKGSIINGVEPFLMDDVHYVPIHPIAGIEKFGVSNAKKRLFENAYCIVTPYEGVNKFALSKVENFIKILGMRIEVMDYNEHDEIFAYISHLPHLIAYGLVGLVEKKNNEKFKFIGGGFKDFTRIASSSEKMWSDIFFLNKDKLLQSLNEFHGSLDEIKTFIKNGDADNLMRYLRRARIFKESLDIQ
jgi:prephenate dehydrogenase